MRPFLCFTQIIPCTPGDNLALEIDIILQHLLQGQNTRFSINKREHDHAKCRLHLRIGIQLIKDHLRIGIPFQINHHMHSLAGGIVVDIRNTFDPLLLHKVCDAFNQPRLINLIRKLGDNDRKSAVFRLLNFRAGAHDDFTAARSIGCTNSRAAHNDVDNHCFGKV